MPCRIALGKTENVSKWKVVVTDYNYAGLEVEKEVLSRWNADVAGFHCVSPQEIIEVAKDADAIISQYAPVTAEVLNTLQNLKAVGRYGIGVDNIDVPAATEKGIVVINVPSYCEEEVSDHALAMLLAWVRKIPHYAVEVRKGIWDWKTGRPICRLHGKVLGLLGFGKIAGRLAAKAKALGLVIIAHDPYLPEGVFSALGVKRGGFEELLSQSDFLSIHVPLTKETRHLIDAKALSLMKPTACLINTSRGAVVDEQALVEALKRGQLAGACLDVLEKEPPDAGNELLQMPRVLISPHVAWYSRVKRELRRKVASDIGRALNGLLPKGLVNSELASQFKEGD